MIRWLRAVCLHCGMSRADVADAEVTELWDVARIAVASGRVATPAEWGIRVVPGSLLAAMTRGGRAAAGPSAL